MSLVDQFESVFRGADRRRYQYQRIDIERVLVLSDLAAEDASAHTADYQRFLVEAEDAEWTTLSEGAFDDVDEMRRQVDALSPSLIVTYRNLRYNTWRWPYSLGVYLNVLTRETDYPVLVMPNPRERPELRFGDRETDRVMVLADHLTGDDALVNWGARFTRPNGKLMLVHLEDDAIFDRYIEVIGKLPSIDTDVAREDIRQRLLKEPADYVDSCREELAEQGHLTHEVVPIVEMGHHLSDYVALIERHEIDLLVFHTQQQQDLALGGKAYSLAVQLRDVPVLMV